MPEAPRRTALLLVFTLASLLVSCSYHQNASTENSTPSNSPDFSLTVSSPNISLTAGGSVPIQVAATAVDGFTGSIAIAVNGLPAGITASPATLMLAPGTPQTITLTAAQSAAAATAIATVTATSGTLSHSLPVSLTVTAPSSSGVSFTLSVNPSAVTLVSGNGPDTQQLQVAATAVNGFAGSVNATFSGLPAGVTASSATLTLVPGTPQTVVLTVPGSTPPGTTTITISGVSGTQTATTSLTLTVSAPPSFLLQLAPSTLTLAPGGSGGAVAVTAIPQNGFAGSVNVSLGALPGGVTASPATLMLSPGVPQQITFAAAANAPASSGNISVQGTSSGASSPISETSLLSLTVVTVPDFSLTATPASVSLTAGGTGQPVQVSATALNGFTGTVNIALSGLPSGVTTSPSTLTLSAGASLPITFIAAANAPASSGTITIQGTATGSSGQITETSSLPYVVLGSTVSTVDVMTYHNDLARTGQNLNETTLTLYNVNASSFGILNFLGTDGLVDAEPLYVQNLLVGGQSHNVLYVATEHDTVYAFDADSGAQLWSRSMLQSGETTSDDHGCGQITPEIGITSTPVIDRNQGSNGTIFVVAMSKDSSGNYHQRLHALDLTTGADLGGSPTEIQASYPGNGENSSNGNVIFDPGQYAERASLLLMNSTLYLAWTSHCDFPPYTGWLMAYGESSLQQTAVLNLTPNGGEGAIWMSGAGLAADTSGNIYFLDANGTFDTTLDANGFPNQGDYGNAFLKVSTLGGSLVVVDYFALYNGVAESSEDQDLGSGGALLLPDVADSSGQTHQLAVGAGKDGNIYLVDRNSMGKFDANNNGSIYQELSGALPDGVWSTSAYFNNTVYFGGAGDPIQAFPIVNARLAPASAATGTIFGYPGATPSISANGTSNGIVWAVENTAPVILHAYNAANLQELYNSQASGVGIGNKFITPMIVNGKVYVGTATGVAVFGLLP